ncbi:WXG100 family type VII secretion target [Corynebacterium sp.]|jgi:WXG100 family type VII secretion target|uniref:WXG100 family type VII secretion target n=1 Tax=Corynebacterium sp. TaxID=1720 RepID=UPI0025C2B1F2|nr:WXG100 family type VII secretion target [Corynebacterium sp.]
MSFRTTTEVMQATAGKVDTVNDQVQSELTRLQGTVDGVAGAWKGDAQAAFTQLMLRWHESARELRQALDGISENIRGNARAFQQVEDDNIAAFR